MKILSNIFAGFIASPLVLLWNAIMAVLFDAVYDNVIAPMAGLYGYDLPDVPFGRWVALTLIIMFIQYVFKPYRKNELSVEEQSELVAKKLGIGACIFALSYLIKWICL